MAEQERTEPEGQPTVSAVIPAYNAADTIERALDSVYAQTYDNIIEVIVVDDGSEDATAEIVREKYPDVTLIQQENAGVSVARNVGVEAASGELIAFLDSDDEWLPEKTEKHVAVMVAHPGLALCMCESIPPGARGTEAVSGIPLLHPVTFRGAVMRQDGMRCGCSVWIIRREVMVRHPFDKRLRRNEDLELIRRLAGLGFGVACCRLELSIYYACRERLRREGLSVASAERYLLFADDTDGPESALRDSWLTPEEWMELRMGRFRAAGDIYCLAGDDAAAQRVARAALTDDGGTRVDRMRLWLMARTPRLYAGLRRGVFRIAGK